MAYVHHVAIKVENLSWYLSFFKEVLGMEIEREGKTPAGQRQVWLSGGLQLKETSHPQEDGRFDHLCLMVPSVEEVREKALLRSCQPLPQHHWLALPDGLTLELFEEAR